MKFKDKDGVLRGVERRGTRAWFDDGRELTDSEMERLNEMNKPAEYTCEIGIENAEYDGKTFDLGVSLSCPVSEDTFDHEFGRETVAPYPDESNIRVESYKASIEINLTDKQVMEIINEQYMKRYLWS